MLAERMLNAELDYRLDQEATSESPPALAIIIATATAKSRSSRIMGRSIWRVLEIVGASLMPQPIAKYQLRFPGFDDKIVSMYARRMSVREIQGHLRDLYGIEASPQLIFTVTMASSRKWVVGKVGLRRRCTRSSFFTPFGPRCAMRDRYAAR